MEEEEGIPFQSNFGATKDKHNKTSNFWLNVSKILSKFLPELTQDTFSFTFSFYFFVFLIGIHQLQDTENLFRKNVQLKDFC